VATPEDTTPTQPAKSWLFMSPAAARLMSVPRQGGMDISDNALFGPAPTSRRAKG